MIDFDILFLVCFAIPKSAVKKGSPKKSPASGKKADKKKKTIVEVEETSTALDESFIYCKEQVRNWCHIEYSLFEGTLPKIEINVVTWGPAAKIYTKDDCIAIKTFTVGDFVWVGFKMLHKTLDLDNTAVEMFKDGFIKFIFSQDQNKMMNHVVNDWPKLFKIGSSVSGLADESDELFPALEQIEPLNTTPKALIDGFDNLTDMIPDYNSCLNLIKIAPFEKKIENKINECMTTLSNQTQLEISPKKLKGKKEIKSGKKSKTETKTKALENKWTLNIPSEYLIAGIKNISDEQTDISPSLRYTGVYVSSSKILTNEQDSIFIPLVITIHGVDNFPLKNLETLKVKNIYASYEFSNICSNIRTKRKPLVKNVTFDDTHVFFISYLSEKSNYSQLMERPSVLNLAEALMTRYLKVQLYGEVEFPPHVQPAYLFGKRAGDAYIATPNHEQFLNYKPPAEQLTDVFLGSARYSLIELAKGFHFTHISSVLNNVDYTVCRNFEIKPVESKPEQDLSVKNTGCVPENLFIANSTHLSITVTIGQPLSNLTEYQLLRMSTVYNRVIIIFKNRNDAIEIFHRIDEMNTVVSNGGDTETSISSVHLLDLIRSSQNDVQQSSALSKRVSGINSVSVRSHQFSADQAKASSTSHKDSSRHVANSEHSIDSQPGDIFQNIPLTSQVVTGFFIDDREECIIVMEAIPYTISHIIDLLRSLEECNTRIIYDSSIFFTERFYSCFPSVKMFTVELASSLRSLLMDPLNYLEKNANNLAIQALLVLDLLRKSTTIIAASMNELFPTCDQLLEFNYIFGISKEISNESNFQDSVSTKENILPKLLLFDLKSNAQ